MMNPEVNTAYCQLVVHQMLRNANSYIKSVWKKRNEN